ncbi:hypothetical protein E2320_019712 [Naja naja]|nr:hypothetical protein E2320_019712 [Naja naja]
MLIGLARDLRGIAFALNTKTSYTMLFDWMYPYYTMTIPVLCTEGYHVLCIRLIAWHSGEEETKLNELISFPSVQEALAYKSYPSYLPILQTAVELWYREPACTTPILKLMAEMMQNRSQRLNFDVSSPNGILLFREASKMICTYGEFS